MIDSASYVWRCMCGQENHPAALDCRKCMKQRWKQLGFSRNEALALLALLLPNRMLTAIGR